MIYYATQLDSENQRVKDNIGKENNKTISQLKENSMQILNDLNKFWELINTKNDNL